MEKTMDPTKEAKRKEIEDRILSLSEENKKLAEQQQASNDLMQQAIAKVDAAQKNNTPAPATPPQTPTTPPQQPATPPQQPATPGTGIPESKAVKDFISAFKLEGILTPEFSALKEEQKLKVVQDLKRRIVDLVKSDAQTQYSESVKDAGSIKKIRSSLNKQTELKNFEAKAFEAIKNTPEGKSLIAENLNQLTEAVKDREIVMNEGRPDVVFISTANFPEGSAKKEIERFNAAANKFRSLPYEWGQEKKGKNKKEYDTTKAEYQKLRNAMLETEKMYRGKEAALTYMSELDHLIQIDQLINTHPEFEKELAGFSEKSGLAETGKGLKDMVLGKGFTNAALLAGGYGARWGAKAAGLVSSFSVVGLAVTAGIGAAFGGARSFFRSQDTLIDRQKQARHGQKTIKKDRKEGVSTVEVEHLTKRLDDLIKKIEDTDPQNSEEKKAKNLELLKARIEHTRGKIEKGQVNFGNAKSVLVNQYNLINSLNKALVMNEAMAGVGNEELQKRIEKLLTASGENIAKKTSRAKSWFIIKQTLYGAGLGAGFASVGYTARWLMEQIGEVIATAENPNTTASAKPSVDETINQDLPQASRSLADVIKDTPGVVETEGEKLDRVMREATIVDDVTQGAPGTLPEKIAVNPEAIIQKGEGIEHALRRQILATPEIAKNYGFKDGMDIKAVAGKIAHRMALEHGYVNKVTGEEIRISAGGGEVAYQIVPEADGEFKIQEFRTQDGKFAPSDEIHGDESAFEGEKKEDYEYRSARKQISKDPEAAGTADTRPLQTNNNSMADLMPKAEEIPQTEQNEQLAETLKKLGYQGDPNDRKAVEEFFSQSKNDSSPEDIKLPQEEQVAQARAVVEEKMSRGVEPRQPHTIRTGSEMRIGRGGPDITQDPNYIRRPAGQNIEFRGNRSWPQGERGPGYAPEDLQRGNPAGGDNYRYRTGGYSHGGSFYDNSSREAIIANQQGGFYENLPYRERLLADLSPKEIQDLRYFADFYKNPYGLPGRTLYDTWEIHNWNLVKIFPGDPSGAWNAMKDMPAEKIFYSNPAKVEEGVGPLIDYMRTLSKVSGLIPDKPDPDLPGQGFFSRLFKGAPEKESAEKFVARALQRAARLERLQEVNLSYQG